MTWSHYLLQHDYQVTHAAVRYALHPLFPGFTVVVILSNVLRVCLAAAGIGR